MEEGGIYWYLNIVYFLPRKKVIFTTSKYHLLPWIKTGYIKVPVNITFFLGRK
jgi:hypothetical protein